MAAWQSNTLVTKTIEKKHVNVHVVLIALVIRHTGMLVAWDHKRPPTKFETNPTTLNFPLAGHLEVKGGGEAEKRPRSDLSLIYCSFKCKIYHI